MSFYASQFNNKSSRYCSSNLYGSNLSTVYADGPPPLDDTLEEDDGEIVFRDKNPKKDSPDSKLDNDKSGTVSGETDFNPWSKNDQKDVAVDDFGDFSGFADFSSAFDGNSKSPNDSSWFKNGDNNQSSVTNFNHNFPNNQGKIASSSHKNVEKNEEKTSKDDNFGCFSEEDDSDFDDFCSFTSNNQNTNTEKAEENGSKEFQVSEDSQSKNSTNSDELFKNDKTIHGSNYSLGQNAKKSSFGSADHDFDEFSSSEGGPTLNGSSTSPTNNSSTSHAQNVTSDTHSAMKPTCFSDDDDDFGDFSSSSFDDERGETTKSPDLIINPQQANFSSQPKANEIQNTHINESSSIPSSQSIESEHNPKESKDSDETVQLSQHNGSAETSTEKNDINISDKDNDFTNTDQSKENINNDDDEFGEFSASGSSVTKTEKNKPKELPCINNTNDDNDDFGEFGVRSPPSLPSLHDDADDDIGEFGAVTAPTKENEKKDNDDDDGFGDFGAASPPSLPSPHSNSDNDDEFGNFGSTAVPTSSSTKEKPKNDKEGNDDEFGDFGSTAVPTQRSGIHSNSDNEFGDFGVAVSPTEPKADDDDEFPSVLTTAKNDPHDNATATVTTTAGDDVDDEFGDFGSAPATNKPDFQSDKEVAAAVDDGDNEFGEFGPAPTTTKHNHHDNAAAADDDDDFGDFGPAPGTSKADLHDNNDDDDFGNFGVASPPNKQNKDDDFGDFAEVEQPNSKESKPKSTTEPSSLEPKMPPANDDDDFGQFDSAPSKPSDSGFADFKSSDNTSKGFADFSSMPQESMPSSFHTTKDSQSFSNKDVQHEQLSKVTGSTSVIKPQRSTNPDRLENTIKECFSNKDVTIESHIMIQKIEHEAKSERSSAWQQLLTTEKDGSLRFDWVLSEHQVKMLEGLLMVPVKIQTSVSFKPKGQVPPPLFASSMGLLEPVKGVITPFHHIEEINPSQDPFGAPPEVGVQDLGFGKGSKKETPVFPTEAKDNTSDTVSVSSSLDLDFLAPSSTNGESAKTESRGLFEDDLLGLGMFSEPSQSPRIPNGKNIFKFNNTTIPLATNEGNLSEQAKTVIKDFEDLSFMLSKVLMFPLKSKD